MRRNPKYEHLEITLAFHVGEGFSVVCRLKEVGLYLVQAIPLYISEIVGGTNLLLDHQAHGKAIEGVFANFDDARNAVWAWCWKFADNVHGAIAGSDRDSGLD